MLTYNRGIAKARLGRHQDAIADIDQAIQLRPDFADAYSNRGNTKVLLGRYQEAIADYDQAIRLQPDLRRSLRQSGHRQGQPWSIPGRPSPT